MQRFILSMAVLPLVVPAMSRAEPSAAITCPPISFPDPQQNLASNPGFEFCSVNPVSCQGLGCNSYPPSAAFGWKMHSDNSGSKITTQCVQPGGPYGGARRLRVIATGGESGVFQALAPSKARRMFSAWVRVWSGHVAMQLQGGNTGPNGWSTKIGEWEQLRVCTDMTVPSDTIVIYNQVLGGGIFEVDRVEVRNTP